jgi:mannosyltransferase
MIILILILGLSLRLINLNQSLWLDESINVLAAKNLNFWHFVTGYPIGDFHPPLYFALLWIWGHLFGFSEVSVRMPSVLLGVGTIYLTYLIGKKFFSPQIGLLAALFLSLGPLHIYYSQEARMYSLAAFAVTFSSYLLLNLLEKRTKLTFILYGLSVALVFYSDYVAYLIFPAQLIYVLFHQKDRLKSFLLSFLIGVIIFSPWLTIFPEQLSNGRQTAVNVPGWAKVVGGSNFKNLVLVYLKIIIGRISLINKLLYGVLAVCLFAVYGLTILINLKKLNKSTFFLFYWLIIPTLCAFLFSYFIPILSYFRMIFIIPAFCLLLAQGVMLLPKKVGIIAAGIVVLTSIICISFYYTNPFFQREDWKNLAAFLNHQNKTGSLVIFEDNGTPAPYKYYDTKKVEAVGGLNNFPANNPDDLKDLPTLVNGKDKIYLVDYLVEISDPQREIDRKLTQSGFRVVYVHNFPGIGFIYEYNR